jgi:hypothetical protein
MPVILAIQEAEAGRKIVSLRPALAKLLRPYLKNKVQKQKFWRHGSSGNSLA